MFIYVFGQTDIGKKRENNEDSYLCLSLQNSHQPKFLISVADGMGGHTGGEIASSIAIETIRINALSQFDGAGKPESEFPLILENCVQKANHEVFLQASQEKELTGMGSTLVVALISENKTFVGNVGDSRAYLIRNKAIQQITSDHNWKNEQRQKGGLSEEDINNSPYKDLITRSLGLLSEVKIDIFEIESQAEDILLLSSDGLHSLLSEKDILKIFRKNKDIQKICQKLIDAANKRGGHDNITVVLAHLYTEGKEHNPKTDTVKINLKNH
ncbi:MAG: Stp1/IreP family PP2C-type Ser/Thr phosphatase [Candidatus Aminicenantes bacterium]|nr:Stp1/IreP family PP2C-type Ser/Thr phosphatase [Candidatus Aminicenantes bacterium]